MKRLMWINLVVGLWLIVSPFVLGYDTGTSAGMTALVNDLVIGVVLAATAGWILAGKAGHLGLSWLQVLCGLWLVIAPFALRGRDASMMTNWLATGVIAIVVGGLETWALTPRRERAA